ncbi:hypothetical protein B0G76_1329 [Paraburkholderia sp. BL23I1N1]|uniref:hypothetical protein n=1 Tax=Paraburkholderia sp. BL23I1N1 TaxID=1938802 RepID=UPI000FF27D91|nr:hypothetical protein [Paraburkholderia sp. BL23I1N1]RKE35268.1 hypothetical protein B0G76_1329 [Paraburkholderia sp. BL23I1N1]
MKASNPARDEDDSVDENNLMPAIDRAHSAAERLETSIVDLRRRVTPILLPSHSLKSSEDDDRDERKEPDFSPASAELAVLIRRINDARAQIELITHLART